MSTSRPLTRSSLILQSLRYHWRNSLAVILGVIVGAAVIVGALLVGDSVRFSLRKVALERLGGVDAALVSPRHLFREKIADAIVQKRKSPGLPEDQIAPALFLSGSAETRDSDSGKTLRRAGRVQIYGVDANFWKHARPNNIQPPGDGEVTINASLARHLQLPLNAKGEPVVLQVELPAAIPRDSLLGDREETVLQVPLKVARVIRDDEPVGNFSLRPDQQLPWNAFVDLRTLQSRMQIGPRKPSFREPQGSEGRVNVLLACGSKSEQAQSNDAVESAKQLSLAFYRERDLSDLQLRLKTDPKSQYWSLTSDQMILDADTVTRANHAVMMANPVVMGERIQTARLATTSPVYVYLINEITVGQSADTIASDAKAGANPRRSMYSVAAGLEPEQFQSTAMPPFGPFEFVGDSLKIPLGEGNLLSGGIGEVILNDWVASDLGAKIGDTIRLKFNLLKTHGDLSEQERLFRLRGILKLKGTVAEDRALTPDVPGITDAKSLVDWRQPFPMKMNLITRRDEEYWTAHRATPKIFLSLKSAQHLWRTRYGDLTSLRVSPPVEQTLEVYGKRLKEDLLAQLSNDGTAFRPVKQEALQAAAGTTDFSGLFLGFSMFLIFSAAALIGLLFRLGVERRAVDIGLWLAVGFTPRQVRWLLLGEACVLVVVGVSLGVLAGIGYAATMIHGLNTWWVGAIGTPFLKLHAAPQSVIGGWVGAAIVSMLSLLWGLRKALKVPVRSLLAGDAVQSVTDVIRTRRGRVALSLLIFCGVTALLLLGALLTKQVPEKEAFSGFSWATICFFNVGFLVLVGGLAGYALSLDKAAGSLVRRGAVVGLAFLGISNCVRNRTRSLLSAALIAFATFLIVAMAVAHRDPAKDVPDKNSGNGGFSLLAESSLPILPDFNTPAGRTKLNLDGDTPAEQAEFKRLFASVKQVVPFRVNPGENASCTNLYRPAQPTILGVTPDMIARGGFKFVGAKGDNPWSLLTAESSDGTIPVFGDMNTLMYSLHVEPGSVLEIRNEANRPVKLKVSGMFDGSVFQGVLLMSEANFQKLFPSRVGYQYFLFDAPTAEVPRLAAVLESRVPGLSTESVMGRIAGFLAVQNTYLSTFQTLGGLGLLLGTVGLGTVMLRNVLERRTELALLRAVGFSDMRLASIVLWENLFVLLSGLTVGTLAALLALTPHITSIGAQVPWRSLAGTLLAVLAAGLLSSLAAIISAVRTPVLETLRGE